MVNINEDVNHARQESVEFLTKYYGENAIASEFLDMWLACGSPLQVAEKIASFIEAGCTTPVLRFTSPNQRAQLERAANEVMPQLRNA
jgi:hypothetical protein